MLFLIVTNVMYLFYIYLFNKVCVYSVQSCGVNHLVVLLEYVSNFKITHLQCSTEFPPQTA